MGLVEHAEREMKLAGLYDESAPYGRMIPEAVMALVKAHSEQGHSGGSHAMVMAIFNKVINFEPLTDLSSNADEWMDVSEMSGMPLWQNRRKPSVFSIDAGSIWYDINDPEKKNWPIEKT